MLNKLLSKMLGEEDGWHTAMIIAPLWIGMLFLPAILAWTYVAFLEFIANLLF